MPDQGNIQPLKIEIPRPRVRDLHWAVLLFSFVIAPALGTGKYLLGCYLSTPGIGTADVLVAAATWVFITVVIYIGLRRGVQTRVKLPQ